MKQQILKFLKSFFRRIKQGFTLLIVPNASSKKIKSCRIPFIPTLIILSVIVFNIYVFIGYTSQVWMINQYHYKITRQKQIIAKYRAERHRINPVLEKDRAIESQLTVLKQTNQELEKTWKRVRQKGRLNLSIASRGGPRNKIPGYHLNPLQEAEVIPSSLEKLDHNLVQIEDIIQQETDDTASLLADLKAYERKLDHTPSIWPVYTGIASRFGRRLHPISRTYKNHEGVDLRAAYGTKVLAAADGVVSFAGWEGGYGNLIKIQHEYGYETRYGHNSRLLVHEGQTVKKGQIISYSGNSGSSTGPHLHYEVRVSGTPVNPVRYLNN
ncbi:MAG TPA: M23 family metallopeptidase [Bacillota bacterium]|nr:M23 family metallopeptidase [Bacillota bacterium]